MNLYSATYIFPVSRHPVANGIVATKKDGTVIGVYDSVDSVNADLKISVEPSSIKKMDGAICPGFINAHCHLELSHLKNKILAGGGLTNFISQLLAQRTRFKIEEIAEALIKAGDEMWSNGIVAVGDISNTNVSFAYKNSSPLYFHTFIELLDLQPSRASAVFEEGRQHALLLSQNLRNNKFSLVPHAPYTVSPNLLKRISTIPKNSPVSIHNQETASENDLFKNKTGMLSDFFKSLGNTLEHLQATEKSSLQSYTLHMNPNEKTLFVHNTFTTKEDVTFASNYFKEPWWCLCPKANLFIENVLPDIPMLHEASKNIVLGTDSYGSNTTLSILEEMKMITDHYPTIGFADILRYATFNGSIFLNIDDRFGSIEKGKKPGLNLITNVSLKKLSPDSQVKKLA